MLTLHLQKPVRARAKVLRKNNRKGQQGNTGIRESIQPWLSLMSGCKCSLYRMPSSQWFRGKYSTLYVRLMKHIIQP